jgi:hypothetical protein
MPYPDNYVAASAPDAPERPSEFSVDPDIVVSAMLKLQSDLDQWRDELAAECSADDVATVERAVEAVLARAQWEAHQ